MARSIRTAAVLALALTVGGFARVSASGRWPGDSAQAALAARVESPTFGTSVAMDDQSGRPVVDVWINGRGPFPFIVGTGASMTVVTQDLAYELNLTSGSERLPASPFVVDELQVGGSSVRGVPVGRTAIVASQEDTPARGILSPASFPGLLFVLDYPAGKLKLVPGALPASDGQSLFEYGPEETVPTVRVDVAGHPFDVQVDSTAPGGLTLPTRSAADLPLADAPVEIGRVTDVLGELPVSVATLNGVVGIGEWPLDIHSIIFSDVRSAWFAGTGSIGARILEGFVVTLDVRNHRVRFDRPGS